MPPLTSLDSFSSDWVTELCADIVPFALWASLPHRGPGNYESLLYKEYIFELLKLPLVFVLIYFLQLSK